MSKLSQVVNSVESTFAHFMQYIPAEAQPEAQAAVAATKQTITDTEASLVSTVETAAAPTLASLISKDVPSELQPVALLALQLGFSALAAKVGSL